MPLPLFRVETRPELRTGVITDPVDSLGSSSCRTAGGIHPAPAGGGTRIHVSVSAGGIYHDPTGGGHLSVFSCRGRSQTVPQGSKSGEMQPVPPAGPNSPDGDIIPNLKRIEVSMVSPETVKGPPV